MNQAEAQQAAMGQREYTDTDRLVARIDADIRKLQEWRAYVLGQTTAHPTDDAPKAKRTRGKAKAKPGLPAQEPTL